MLSLPYTLALAAGSAFLANAAVLPRGQFPSSNSSSSSRSSPEPRWGQAAVHLPAHKSAIFLGGRSDDGELLHRADVLNISALHEGVPSAQAWSSLPLSKGVPASTFASAVALPGESSSFLLLGGETETCAAAPGYIFTGQHGAAGLNGTWSALQTASTVYDRSHIQALPVHNATSQQHSILVAGKASARPGCDGANLTLSPATTEQWVVERQAKGVRMAVDFTPVPRHLRRDLPVRDYAAVALERENGTEMVLFLGGLTSKKSPVSLRHLWALDVPTGAWKRVRTAGPVHGGLHGHTATLMPDNKVVVIGGYLGTGKNRTMSSSTLVLDLNQSPPTWSVKAASQPRVFHSALAVGHKLIVAFGKVERSAKRASQEDVMFLDTKEWTWSNQFHAASDASSSSAQASASASVSKADSATSVASGSSSKQTDATGSSLNFGSTHGLQSTLSGSSAALPTGDSVQHAAPTNSGSHGISDRTLAAILAPTLSVALALLLWLVFALCVWRYIRRRRAQAVDEKRGGRSISSMGRGVPVSHGRRHIESNSTLASEGMWKEEVRASRSWSLIEHPEPALMVTSPSDKYTPIRANSVRNLHNFRGRASIKRARETARYQAAQAQSQDETKSPFTSVTPPPPAVAARDAPVMDEASWIGHRPNTTVPSLSNGSAVSYPYLQGVPRASVSSAPMPEEQLPDAVPAETLATEEPPQVPEQEPQSTEARRSPENGWFKALTSGGQAHGTPVLPSIPLTMGDESDVDPFRGTAAATQPPAPEQQPGAEPELPEWMQSSPLRSPSMQSARSLRGNTPAPSLPASAPTFMPTSASGSASGPTGPPRTPGPQPEPVRRTLSGRPLPSAPAHRRTPSAYELLYTPRASVSGERRSSMVQEPVPAPTLPPPPRRAVTMPAQALEEQGADELLILPAGKQIAIPRVLRPSQSRSKTFHEDTLQPAAVQVERPFSYHGPRQTTKPVAKMMCPGAPVSSSPAQSLLAPKRVSQLYAPSEGSRASSPTPSERMFGPEGANGIPPAFRLAN